LLRHFFDARANEWIAGILDWDPEGTLVVIEGGRYREMKEAVAESRALAATRRQAKDAASDPQVPRSMRPQDPHHQEASR